MKSTKTKATQDFVPMREIRDGVLILKDGSMRMILLVSSMNFSLKSNDEKQAILFQYQNFLNSLDFHIQIFIQSRRLDIKPYLLTLEAKIKDQTNELLKIQTREYIDFIKSFTESYNVMSKGFFIVVPYYPALINSSGNFFSRLMGRSQLKAQINTDFIEAKTQLEQRVSVVEQGMRRIGLQTVPLGTEELIELFFRLFNPGESDVPSLDNNQTANQNVI
ncbi:MAG: hypothetical protein COX02_02345 [Candidatus Vogelbacteria bacterium CG22_combo_CG10-13_8_21_14_all_37_9]|uniref:TraC-like domain-containing protein n=1 Tax=Candidatus Vogelbacteria bacterium CG22_combo_CG10-13_8_21_14_all_37_9 TaxID=1975046 RepID=A0A2H0BKF3_9BACT|nr:MAG: hypothetical protein COX02_02345 [Candidatus Vogelbacteria bacterium CG22_combo_CG10-13_8_21_14_all_37_9]